ncbi:MAG: BadF/BadG/BcrA/BcrD ATPase family protein [Gordonia sp. (in: high G+C Gram-positive bacteria)]
MPHDAGPGVLAFDIGGSTTHAVWMVGETIRAETVVGSANISSVGMSEAGRQLDRALAGLGRPDRVDVVFAGSAGADTPVRLGRLRDLLAGRFPAARIGVVHDAELVLAAAGLADGIVAISGTGCVAWGRRGDRTTRSGGWGHLLGDEGAGYGIARAAVRGALREVDDGCPPGELARRLARVCDVDDVYDLLDAFYLRADPDYWAARAAVVFELADAGDDLAGRLVGDAAAALGDLVIGVAGRLGRDLPVVCAGGQITHHDRFVELVRTTLAAAGIADVRVLAGDPVAGAIRLGRELLTR